MLLIFCSSFTNEHETLKKLALRLRKESVEYVTINPLHLATSDVSLVQEGSEIFLRLNGSKLRPQKFLFLNNWRVDSAIQIPDCVKYPGAFRLRVFQFLQDIRFAFEGSRWIPAKLENIERADSKLRLIVEARNCGLITPAYTINTGGQALPPQDGTGMFRKSIGPAFSVSLNTETGKEVGVTTVGTLSDSFIRDGQLWQWQEPISTVTHVRCFVCGDHVWSVCWNRKDKESHADYRFVGQVSGQNIEWQPYELPSETASGLAKLLECLSLQYASPEFLIDKDGEHVFIDLNPCGDWSGFFSDKTESEILDFLVAVVKR